MNQLEDPAGERTVKFDCGCVVTTWKLPGTDKRVYRQDRTCDNPEHPLDGPEG